MEQRFDSLLGELRIVLDNPKHLSISIDISNDGLNYSGRTFHSLFASGTLQDNGTWRVTNLILKVKQVNGGVLIKQASGDMISMAVLLNSRYNKLIRGILTDALAGWWREHGAEVLYKLWREAKIKEHDLLKYRLEPEAREGLKALLEIEAELRKLIAMKDNGEGAISELLLKTDSPKSPPDN